MGFAKGNKIAKGGKRPNSGPKKLSVHQLCAVEFEKRIPILCQIADDEINRPLDRIAAIKELARVGVPAQLEVTGKDGGAIKGEYTIDLSGLSDDELIKVERAFTRGASGVGAPGRN